MELINTLGLTDLDPNKNYYRVMLGQKSAHARQCYYGQFIGGDWQIIGDLTDELVEDWRDFNARCIPKFLDAHPEKSRVAAGLACGALHTICRGAREGDVVLCPNGTGEYLVGVISGGYTYEPDGPLPHRRPVTWQDVKVPRSAMSTELKRSSGSIGTVANLSKYSSEIEALIGNISLNVVKSSDPSVEDASSFALEKHLEDFLVANWASTSLGQTHDIFSEDGELIGQQYPTDTGPIDILAISKDKRELLVIELKKGRASDAVVGQIQRYMGYVMGELAEPEQIVRGAIIALEDDKKIRYALKVNPSIFFYRYEVKFQLIPS